jgi:arginine N-succinyltransferase
VSSPDHSAHETLLVRPAVASDLAALHALVVEAEGALERFDDTPEAVAAIIASSEKALAGQASIAQQNFLLVADDGAGHLAGCIGLTGRIGLEQPFYDYRLGKIVHSSRPLASYRCLEVLYLCNDLTGCSEAHSLYVRRDCRQRGTAQRLVKAAQLFIATHADAFAPRIIVELRGVIDEAGRSPFWEAVGRHFFRVDQRRAERLVAQGSKAFLAELMPKHPVYVALLPESAQQAVGGLHHDIDGLAALLEAEGFRFESHVDIFDGGRVLEGHTHELTGVARSRRLRATVGAPATTDPWWLAAGRGGAFRALGGRASAEGDTLTVSAPTLEALGAGAGDELCALAV